MSLRKIRNCFPKGLDLWLSETRLRLKRARIHTPTGKLDPSQADLTFVLAVGPTFDQDLPIAMMVARMGYCHAFEELGIPYLIADVRDLPKVVQRVPNAFIMYAAEDIAYLPSRSVRLLRRYRSAVWVPPWFQGSDRFFASHGLDSSLWDLPAGLRRKIVSLEPKFCFTATVPSGLCYFENWTREGVPAVSLPLACDTSIYRPEPPLVPEFAGVGMTFVGGYWTTKGAQIDEYLRRFEDELVIYGYSRWPYGGYRGQLPQDGSESSLYRQARVCPVVNEPTVALLRGQINERVFKVLGSRGCPVVDAVPAYRELYSEDELLIAEDADHFEHLVRHLLADEDLNRTMRLKGFQATMERHTYRHRAEEYLARIW